MAGVTLDTGALIAASRDDRRFGVWWKWLTSKGLVASVPSPVVAQAWRSGRDARLAVVLGGCREVPLDASASRRTGELCGRAGTADVVDAFAAPEPPPPSPVPSHVLAPDDLIAIRQADWLATLRMVGRLSTAASAARTRIDTARIRWDPRWR